MRALATAYPSAWRSGPRQATPDIAARTRTGLWCTGGPISAVGRLEAGFLVIEVWNDGESIGAAAREQIFSPNWRRGLYLCRQIAEAHAGSISVLSRQGEGTLLTAKISV